MLCRRWWVAQGSHLVVRRGMRYRRSLESSALSQWDGIARYHDGTPVEEMKRMLLDAEMRAYERVRDRLKDENGWALEEQDAMRPQMTGMR